MSAFALSPVAYADGETAKVKEAELQGADNMMTNILGIVLTVFRYIGIFMTVWGVAMVVMAFRNEDAEGKTKGIMVAVAGIVLVTLKSILGFIFKELN